jgi:hypothetical protein
LPIKSFGTFCLAIVASLAANIRAAGFIGEVLWFSLQGARNFTTALSRGKNSVAGNMNDKVPSAHDRSWPARKGALSHATMRPKRPESGAEIYI